MGIEIKDGNKLFDNYISSLKFFESFSNLSFILKTAKDYL